MCKALDKPSQNGALPRNDNAAKSQRFQRGISFLCVACGELLGHIACRNCCGGPFNLSMEIRAMCYDGDGVYLASFPFSGGEHGDEERTIISIRGGLVYTMDDGADGPSQFQRPTTFRSRNWIYGLIGSRPDAGALKVLKLLKLSPQHF